MKNETLNILVIIPARGGSKGIPRKNLRTLAGQPLLYYSIRNGLSSSFNPDVYVSSDDDEIISISQKLGAKIVKRHHSDADDQTTLDPVIYRAYAEVKNIENKNYDFIVTLQPTSPLLKVASLDSALRKISNSPEIHTIISAINDTHLTWRYDEEKYLPNYKQRLNRQQLNPEFKETGGFLITRPEIISETNRIGENVDLHLLKDDESIDIDTFADWGLCEYYLKRKRVLFVVSGYREIGLGHVYNTLLIANDILEHEVIFLVDKKSQLAYEKISSKNYLVYMQSNSSLIDNIDSISPDIIINDRLDTEWSDIDTLKKSNYLVINFEDLGTGAGRADLTINAIYPEKEVLPNHYFGHKYFILRDEFILTEPHKVKKDITQVLLSFGGVDPNNYTLKILEAIYDESIKRNINISAILGFGYNQHKSLEKFKNITIHKDIQNISDHMKRADIIFSSAGRTTYEIASLNVPAIILAQNERELTHFFANAEHGFVNLGLGTKTSTAKILQTFLQLIESTERRVHMSHLMSKCDLISGRKRVVSLIKRIIHS